MVKEVTCPCGWRARGTEKEIIALVVEHGRTAHSQDLTADDVRPIWYDVSETSA